MHDPTSGAGQTRDAALRGCLENLRALRSAWGVLAPSGLTGEKLAITETGRALAESVKELLRSQPSSGDGAAIAALDTRLQEFERELRDVALEVPVAQLRATLPERLAVDRRGVLDLLDLLLGAEIAGLEGTRARLPMLDYLITRLCTGGDPDAPPLDPVTLTPRLHGLCERTDVDGDPHLAEIEAELLAAVDLPPSEVRKEIELRMLRRRKMGLGSAFFAPRVLRAIVTYNVALLHRIDQEVLSSQDWGMLPKVEAPGEGGSVFESPALPKLADALRRRIAGAPPAHDPLDRIAWCLDLTTLSSSEREAVRAESVGRRGDLAGTTILVGLLRRSAIVLDEEFPAIGIGPEQLSGAWLQELDQAHQQEVNRRIKTDDYEGACILSDLRSRFLGGARPGARRSRVQRPVRPRVPMRVEANREARQIAIAALEAQERAEPVRRPRDGPSIRAAPMAAAGLLAMLALFLAQTFLWEEGRLPRAELARVSPLLSDGKRNGDGTGFAGTLDDRWLELADAQQAEAADALVRALRERGVREIMIYDDDRRLRIQALGSQPPRVVPAASVQ